MVQQDNGDARTFDRPMLRQKGSNNMVQQDNGDVYLTAKEAMEKLQVSRQALDGYVRRGLLHKYKRPLVRRVYFKQSEIDLLLEIRPEH